jgi:chromosome segregation ATPase
MNELIVYVNALKTIADRYYGKEVIFYDSGDWYSRDHCRNLTPEEVATYVIETAINYLGEEDEECSEANPDVTDLLANLARRVSSLEQQLSATQGNVEKLAEELANVTHWNKKHATMFGKLYEDVRLLKDCAHPKEVEVVTFEKFLDSVADDVAKKLAEKVTNDLRTEMRLKALRGF